jgi:hypothetical protein
MSRCLCAYRFCDRQRQPESRAASPFSRRTQSFCPRSRNRRRRSVTSWLPGDNICVAGRSLAARVSRTSTIADDLSLDCPCPDDAFAAARLDRCRLHRHRSRT